MALKPLREIRKYPRLGPIVAALLVIAILALVSLVLKIITAIYIVLCSNLEENSLRDLSFLLAFMVGAPFVAWRAKVAQDQVNTARAALVNDKINAATDGLHAQRQVTKKIDKVFETHWEDDIIRRSAAIDQLEALAKQEPSEARRIARMLCTYVKELSREYPAELRPTGLEIDSTADLQNLKLSRDIAHDWFKGLSVKRNDCEKAVQSLAKLNEFLHHREGEANEEPVIDLRGANLQAMNLNGLNLSGARLDYAKMDAIQMHRTNLKGSFLISAHLSGANLIEAQLNSAKMKNAELHFATLFRAIIPNAELIGAKLPVANIEGADLQNTGLNAADLRVVFIRGNKLDKYTDFTGANLKFSALKFRKIVRRDFQQQQIDSMFGDATVELSSCYQRPQNWPDVDLLSYDIHGEGRAAFHKEWRHWQSNPDTYDWPSRKHLYTEGRDYTVPE